MLKMKLATNNLKFQGLNEELVDFSMVETINQLEDTLVQNYVILCRKCASESFCKFYDASEPPCPILEKVVHNYINMNIKSIDANNSYELTEFIKSIIFLIQIFYLFENWRGIYVDEEFNWYFESVHPKLNLNYSHKLLTNIANFIDAYKIVKTDRLKKFVVFIEGNSEDKALPPIFDALGVVGIDFDIKNSVKFINLEEIDRIQRDKIKTNLLKYKEEEVSYFLILDNDPNVKNYIDDLKREKLIEDSHCLIWKNKFEDNFDEETILNILKEENDDAKEIDIKELKQYNLEKNDIAKSIEHLLRNKNIEIRFDDYKVKIALRLSERICKEIEESMRTSSGDYNGRLTPTSKSFPEFVEQVRKIAEEMKKISSEFHVIKTY